MRGSILCKVTISQATIFFRLCICNFSSVGFAIVKDGYIPARTTLFAPRPSTSRGGGGVLVRRARDEVLFEVRAAFDRNRTAAGTAAVARLLGEGMAHVQRLADGPLLFFSQRDRRLRQENKLKRKHETTSRIS